LTGTAKELADRASAVAAESQKKRISDFQQTALQTFADHLRKLALERDDGSLTPDVRSRLQIALDERGAKRVPVSDIERKLPKGRWRRLLEVTSAKEIRELNETNRDGEWTILENGTLISTDEGFSKLQLPIGLNDSYAIRLLCNPGVGQNANVVLPLGPSAVVFCLGWHSGSYSGLDRVDGKSVSDSQNPTHIPKSKFPVQTNVPVLVEIRVELLAVDEQSEEQRQQAPGSDWANISVFLNRQPRGMITGPVSRFTADPIHVFTSDVISFSTQDGAAFSNIQLKRM
jgi:hypothetical protein